MTEKGMTQTPAAEESELANLSLKDTLAKINEGGDEPAKAEAAKPARQQRAAAKPVKLSMKDVLAAVNDGADDPGTVAELQKALYRFGAQDPSFELPRSWQRVQRRIGVDPNQLDGIATAEQVTRFAERAGLTIAR